MQNEVTNNYDGKLRSDILKNTVVSVSTSVNMFSPGWREIVSQGVRLG